MPAILELEKLRLEDQRGRRQHRREKGSRGGGERGTEEKHEAGEMTQQVVAHIRALFLKCDPGSGLNSTDTR